MRNLLRLMGLIAFLVVLPSAHATDVTGTWKGAFDLQGANMPLVFHFKAAGSGVTGTVEGLPTGPVEIHDGKVDGDTITFWLNADYQGQTYKIVYTGKVSEGQIEFNFGTDDGSWSASMTVKNSDAPAVKPIAPDVTGTWKGAFDLQGTSMLLSFHFKVVGSGVTGTVEGLPTGPVEIHDGKVDGNTITFWLNADYQGQTYKVVYTGKISEEQIEFNFGTDDGSWSTALTAKKSS